MKLDLRGTSLRGVARQATMINGFVSRGKTTTFIVYTLVGKYEEIEYQVLYGYWQRSGLGHIGR